MFGPRPPCATECGHLGLMPQGEKQEKSICKISVAPNEAAGGSSLDFFTSFMKNRNMFRQSGRVWPTPQLVSHDPRYRSADHSLL